MNNLIVERCEKLISEILFRKTPLIIDKCGLPNSKWSNDVRALRILKAISTKYQR